MDLQKLNTKENAKRIRLITKILAFVALAIIGLGAIMPIVRAYIPGSTDPDFTYATGQNFLGWQVTFYYFGPGLRVNDRQAFHWNVWMIIAMVGTGLVLLITALMMKKGKRFKNGILDLISVVFIIYSIIIYCNACPIVLKTAGNLTRDALESANKNGGWTLAWFTYVEVILLSLIAVAKIGCGLFNIIFKNSKKQQPEDKVEVVQG